MKNWNIDIQHSALPRYQAIVEAIHSGIQSKQLALGEKLPTHRALAEQLGVTVGTVTRAYAEAEKRGLVIAKKGSGTFVNDMQARYDSFSALSHKKDKPDGIIDFSLNLPLPLYKEHSFQLILQSIANDVPQLDLLTYQAENGTEQQRQWAESWLQKQGMMIDWHNITITNGGQHAITLALMSTLRPGESIISEGLTYPGLNAIATQLGIKVTGIAADDEGMIPERLEEHCQNGHYRALYLTPSAQNPCNTTMSLARRKAILAIAKRYHLWIIEDTISLQCNNYGENSFYNLAPALTFCIISHSKQLAAGLRVGYLLSPKVLTATVSTAMRSHCWFAAPLTVEVAQRWIDHPDFTVLQQTAQTELAARIALARTLLAAFDCRIADNSFHIWLTLPEPWRASDFKARMEEKGVLLLTAEPFAVGRYPTPQAIRICLSAPATREQVETGLTIIRDELQEGVSARLTIF